MILTNINYKYILLLIGIIIGILFVLIFFGIKIEPKSIPKIKINIGNFVKNSHIYLFNKHLHHWFINLCILVLVFIIEKYYPSKYFNLIKGFNLVLIVHGLLYDDCFDFAT